VAADKNQENHIVQHEDRRDEDNNRPFNARGSRPTHNRAKAKGQSDCEKNDHEVRQAIRLKRVFGIHRKGWVGFSEDDAK
jgi:hypothetical protein